MVETTRSDVQDDRPENRSSYVYPAEEDGVTPMRLLQSGIPLSLLLDLVLGPQSADLLVNERSGSHRGLVRRAKAVGHAPDSPVGAV